MQSNGLHFVVVLNFFLSFWHAVVFLFGYSLVFFTHLLVLLIIFPNFMYDCISLQLLILLACCCLFYEFVVSSSFVIHLSFFVVLFPFILFGCALVFSIHPLVLLISPTLCMIVFHYIFSFWVWCCLFHSFIVPSSFCHLCFVTVFCNFISICFGMLLAFLFGRALVFFNFVYDCISLWVFSFWVLCRFLFIYCYFFFLLLVFCHSFL